MNIKSLLGPKSSKKANTSIISGVILPPLDVEGALRIAAVFDAVRILSEDVASLPLHVYEGRGADRQRAEGLRLEELLQKAPNDYQSAMDFREAMTASLLLTGHGYAEIERTRTGEVRALHFVDPHRVSIHVSNQLQFKIDGEPFPTEKLFHLHGFSTDGIQARAIARQACDSLELSRHLDIFTRQYFRSGGSLKAVLKYDKKLTDDAHRRLRESWRSMYEGGPNRAFQVAILEEGLDYVPISSKPEESQLLELRKFQVTEVARWFRLPPHMLGDLERATHSNIEQQALEYTKYTLRPWLVRWEQALNRQLLGDNQFSEHVVEGLLRADIKSRYDAYAVGRQWGWLSVNDIRRRENLPPVEGGDDLLKPLNMTNLNASSRSLQL
jgi:HK97 family phage portal protein